MGVSFGGFLKPVSLTSAVLLLIAPAASQNGFYQIVDSTFDNFVKTADNSTDSSDTDNQGARISVQGQEAFNQGTFNSSSVDRNDDSGNLGIGYLNGTSTGQPQDGALNNGSLVAYYRMDRAIPGTDGTVRDYSGQDNSGNTQGSLTSGQEGILSTESLSYDGQDDKVSSDIILGTADNSFSVSGWIKSPDPSLSGQNLAFLTNYPNSISKDGFWMVGTDDTSSGMFFWMRNQDQSVSKKTSKYDVFDGSWHHITAIRDAKSDEMRFYIDGELEENLNFAGDKAVTDSSGNSELSIMEHFDRFLPGKTDEIRIYNRSLNTSEVKQLYFHGTSGKFKAEYIKSVDIPSEDKISKLQVDSKNIDPMKNISWFKIGNNGENEVIELDTGSNDKNYSLDFSDTGGMADITINITQSTSKPTSTPVIEDFSIWTQSTSSGEEVKWTRWG